jgi:hypothetical protein
VLVADLDLDQRRDWLELFPFLATRRPDSYAGLTVPVDREHPQGAAPQQQQQQQDANLHQQGTTPHPQGTTL